MTDNPPPTEKTPANAPYKPLTFDPAKFEHMLDGYDLTEAQRREYLEALWMLVLGFVDLKMPPLFEDSCGQNEPREGGAARGKSPVLNSSLFPIQMQFRSAANSSAPPNDSKEVS